MNNKITDKNQKRIKMSQLLDENDQRTLNYLGSAVSSCEIKRSKIYLAYYTTDGFIDTIFLWDSKNIPNFGQNGYLKMVIGSNYSKGYNIKISLNNEKTPNIIELSSRDKSQIIESLNKFQHVNSIYFHSFFKKSDSLEFIGGLNYLKTLSIFNFSSIIIPDSIGNLSNLTNLRISIVYKPFFLPKTLKNLRNLEKLHIRSGNFLEFPKPSLKKFPEFILNFKKLTHLSLRTNLLDSIPPSISSLSNLKELDLCDNNLSTLPHSMENLENLTHLNIAWNNFRKIPECIKHLKSLKSIDIGHNFFVSLESFKYIFSNPNLTIDRRFRDGFSFYPDTTPKEVINYWYAGNYEKIMQYYTPPIAEIAQKYAKYPKSLTNHEIERLKFEAAKEERDILELSLSKDDPILKIINEKLKIQLRNGLGLMR